MSTKEPLSTSVENPNHKTALLDQYKEEEKQLKEKPKDIAKELDKLPLPCGWRILVLPFEASKKSKGGIIYSDSAVESVNCINLWKRIGSGKPSIRQREISRRTMV